MKVVTAAVARFIGMREGVEGDYCFVDVLEK